MYVIDGEVRRAALTEAVWELVRRHGLRGASVRAVAREAGLSAGSVRHFFPTQNELHAHAMESLAERIVARIAAHEDMDDLLARVEAMVCELLPLTDETETELRAGLDFVAASSSDPRLAGVARETFNATRLFLTKVVNDLAELGLIPADTDVALTAVELNALVDGLTLQLIHQPQLVDRATARSLVAHLCSLADEARAPHDRSMHHVASVRTHGARPDPASASESDVASNSVSPR
jgi:AcrR family transcriptional regulator